MQQQFTVAEVADYLHLIIKRLIRFFCPLWTWYRKLRYKTMTSPKTYIDHIFKMSAIANVSLLFLVTFIHQSSGSCARHGMDFWGADLWNFGPSTFDHCTKLCKAATSCKSITYRPSSKTCWLKYRRGGNHGPSLVPGLISANMDCDYKSDQSCAKHSVDYWGADLGHRTATTLDQCEQFCRDTERCVSLTFRASSRSCWLKHRKSGARGPSTVHGLVSLNMECPPSGTQTSKLVYDILLMKSDCSDSFWLKFYDMIEHF